MGAAIGEILANAIGVAISPVPIIALILMLFSRAALRNGLVFLCGWLLGLAGVGLVVIALGVGSDGAGSDGDGVAKIAIGAVFLLLGLRRWRMRPAAGADPEMPGWMQAVDRFSAARAFGLGLALIVANPKNLLLTVAAAASIGAAGLNSGEEAATLAVYAAIASLTIALPVGAVLAARERAAAALDSARAWLIVNENTMMVLLFVVLGAKILGDGISAMG